MPLPITLRHVERNLVSLITIQEKYHHIESRECHMPLVGSFMFASSFFHLLIREVIEQVPKQGKDCSLYTFL